MVTNKKVLTVDGVRIEVRRVSTNALLFKNNHLLNVETLIVDNRVDFVGNLFSNLNDGSIPSLHQLASFKDIYGVLSYNTEKVDNSQCSRYFNLSLN